MDCPGSKPNPTEWETSDYPPVLWDDHYSALCSLQRFPIPVTWSASQASLNMNRECLFWGRLAALWVARFLIQHDETNSCGRWHNWTNDDHIHGFVQWLAFWAWKWKKGCPVHSYLIGLKRIHGIRTRRHVITTRNFENRVFCEV